MRPRSAGLLAGSALSASSAPAVALAADQFYRHALNGIQQGGNKVAAFLLHQATEHYYKCAILVVTAYWPKEHNIKYLGKLCAGIDPLFRDIFPQRPRAEKRRLELLGDPPGAA